MNNEIIENVDSTDRCRKFVPPSPSVWRVDVCGGRAGDARTSARANWLVKGGDDDDTTGK